MPLDPDLNEFSTASQILSVYNFQDIVSGVGVASFFGATHMEVTTEAPYLTTQSIKSKSTSYTEEVNSTDNGAIVIDLDFDSVMNTARSIKGKVNIIGTMGHQTRSTTNSSAEIKIIATLTNATTSTDIATATSQSVAFPTSGAVGTVKSEVFNLIMDVPTPAVIGAGETLRMTIQLFVVNAGTNSSIVGFGIDPANRNDIHPLDLRVIEDEDDTLLRMDVPMEIQ